MSQSRLKALNLLSCRIITPCNMQHLQLLLSTPLMCCSSPCELIPSHYPFIHLLILPTQLTSSI